MADRKFPHIDVSSFATTVPFTSPQTARGTPPPRDRNAHGDRLLNEFDNAIETALTQRDRTRRGDGPTPDELAIEIRLSAGVQAADLERVREGTRQGAVFLEPNGTQRVALMVPDDTRGKQRDLLVDYRASPLTGEDGETLNPKNNKRVAAIDSYHAASLSTFWRDAPETLPEDDSQSIWWALWCYIDREGAVVEESNRLGLNITPEEERLRFPEVTIVAVYGTRSEIAEIVFGTLGVAELGRATDSPSLFTEDVIGNTAEWVDDYAGRIEWPGTDVPSVCVLDTGVNRAHALIEPALLVDDMASVDPDWGVHDSARHGHGTLVAGLALHGDLFSGMLDQRETRLNHRLESVKLIHPDMQHDALILGSITQHAVALAELNAPTRPFRAFCMPVSNELRTGAEPTIWSAAIDQAASGKMPGDDPEQSYRRLFIISTGNIQDYQAIEALKTPEAKDGFPAEDPAQSWNALTVGGVTSKVDLLDAAAAYPGWGAAVEIGELSPYSRPSVGWLNPDTPFKPDIVMEAGNRAINPQGTETAAGVPALSLVTTSIQPGEVTDFWATSAATPQAARMAAQIAARYPGIWPEMVRALMVHSAEWTMPMIETLEGVSLTDRSQYLLRRYGHGVPDLSRALSSAENAVSLVSQSTIQPFRKNGGSISFGSAHVYELPWPIDILEGLGETAVRLKVTLSYFVEPHPAGAGMIDPTRYRSFGLRFDMKRARETVDSFRARVNKAARADGYRGNAPADPRWRFGPKSVKAGSLHSDIWEGSAAELSSRGSICVYPVNGWWRVRKRLGRFTEAARYALVITLEAPDVETDLYVPILQAIDTPTEIGTGVEITVS